MTCLNYKAWIAAEVAWKQKLRKHGLSLQLYAVAGYFDLCYDLTLRGKKSYA